METLTKQVFNKPKEEFMVPTFEIWTFLPQSPITLNGEEKKNSAKLRHFIPPLFFSFLWPECSTCLTLQFYVYKNTSKDNFFFNTIPNMITVHLIITTLFP